MSREYSEGKEIRSARLEEEGAALLDITHIIDDAFKGVLRFWPMFLMVISICSSLFYIQAKRAYVPRYQSSSTFIVNTSTAVNYGSSYYNKAAASQIAKTFPYIISNSALQHIIAEDLGVETIPGTIEATALDDTNMITISVTADDPETAYEILQSVIKNYPQVAKAVIGETELNIIDETGQVDVPINTMEAQSAARTGFLTGLLFDILWTALYVVTKRTIYREEDFKKILNIKCLGSIPKVKFKKRSNTGKNQLLIDNKRVSYGFVEANRTVRTRIEKDALENQAKVYMVSSAIAGEGKSTAAANLALSLASKGKSVLLVDMDLRNPSVAKTMGIEPREKGFIDVLTDQATLTDITVRYGKLGLWVLPGGHPVQVTTQVLNEKKIGAIFKELRKGTDFVIVDTPPSGLLNDAAQLVKHMDAGIFVVRQDYASIDRILDGVELLTDTGLRLAGCLLTYAEAGITSHAYGKYGGYGSYGSKNTKRSEAKGIKDEEQKRSE